MHKIPWKTIADMTKEDRQVLFDVLAKTRYQLVQSNRAVFLLMPNWRWCCMRVRQRGYLLWWQIRDFFSMGGV